MSGLCSDCKWWERGMYQEMPTPESYGTCDLASNSWFLPPATKVAVRPLRFSNVLTTAADFGCNQFEDREEEG